MPAALAAIVQAKDATLALRQAFIDGVYEATVSLGPTAGRCRKLVGALFSVLVDKEASPLADRLVQVPIYNLLFQFGGAQEPAASVIADASDRARLVAITGGFPSERAAEIHKWLGGEK